MNRSTSSSSSSSSSFSSASGSMSRTSGRLLSIAACSGCALLTVGTAITLLLPPPTATLLIDRSYCAPRQWQQVSQAYSRLYSQHQQKRSRLENVVFFSSLDQTAHAQPPHPSVVASLSTYGHPDSQRQTELEKTYANATVLSCHELP